MSEPALSTPPEAPPPSPAAPMTAGQVIRRLGPAGPLAVAAAVLPMLGGFALLVYIDPVGQWLRGHSAQGLLIYAAIFAIASGLALLPTYAQAFLGGWAFTFAQGFPAALTGFLGGSLIGYEVSRRASGDRVQRLLNEKPRWAAIRDALVGRGFWPTLGIVTLVRLPINSPFAITNLVMASVGVGRAPYLLGTLLGMAPRTGALVFVGGLLRDVSASEALDRRPWWILPVGIASVVVVLLILGAIANRAVARMTQPPPQEKPAPAAHTGTPGSA